MRVLKPRSEEHTSELQSPKDLVCRLLLEKKSQRGDLIFKALVLNLMFAVQTHVFVGRRLHVRTYHAKASLYYPVCFDFFLNEGPPPEIHPLPPPDALRV